MHDRQNKTDIEGSLVVVFGDGGGIAVYKHSKSQCM